MLDDRRHVERLIADAVAIAAAIQNGDEAKRHGAAGEGDELSHAQFVSSIQTPSIRRSVFPEESSAGTNPLSAVTRSTNGPG